MKKCIALLVLPLAGCFPFENRQFTPAVTPVSPADVVGMTESGYSESMILDTVRANGVVRKPTADDVVAMKQAGTTDGVVAAMLGAPVTEARPAQEIYPHHHYDPWYGYHSYYYSSISYGFGFGWYGGRYYRCR